MEEKKQTVLTLKFIGIDDFSCPTYEDQYGRFWKDLNLGKSEKPDLYSTTRNDLDGEPVIRKAGLIFYYEERPGWGASIPHPSGIYL